jgi:hypothetical protein
MSAISIVYITFFVGLALIVVAILGGGIKIKEVEIPQLGTVPRVASFFLGLCLVVLSTSFPQLLPDPSKPDPSKGDT